MAGHRMRALGMWRSNLATPGDVARHLVAVQSQEHALARWSVAQRMAVPAQAADVDAAFDRGELVRTHVLRPTWHFVSAEDLRWLVRFSGPRVAAKTSRYWSQFDLDARALRSSTDAIAAAVEDGPRTRAELGEHLRRRGDAVDGAELAARVMHAELHMAVCSGPMRGRQHTYMVFDQRARGDGPVGEEALALLARRYFTTRGPATAHDFAWWAGLSMAEARQGFDMAATDLEVHEQGGRRYAFAPGEAPTAGPSIDFIQCFDESVVAYRQSRDILSTPRVSFEPLRREDGFVHPILRDGQLLGRWRPTRDANAIEVRLSDALSPSEKRMLTERMEVLRDFLAR